MSWLATNIYIFILAVFLAILEIQIEGPHGWAKNLPTWRPKSKGLILRLYQKLMSDREATGYHMVMFTFVLLMFHLPMSLVLVLVGSIGYKLCHIFLYLWFCGILSGLY